jgi:hypothetical protein
VLSSAEGNLNCAAAEPGISDKVLFDKLKRIEAERESAAGKNGVA